MYHRKKNYRIQSPKSFTLNITSMTDMFTILLVFLLQNYSVSEFNLEPVQGLKLPVSASMTNPTKSEQIHLTKNEIKIGDKIITKIESIDQQSIKIDSLYNALINLKETNPDATWSKNGEIILNADREQNYKTIQKIMYTASIAGFPKLRLSALSGE